MSDFMAVSRGASGQPWLTIIIPAYNEERRLPKSLDAIVEWMLAVPYAVEVLVVENGSQDRTTELAESYARRFSNVQVIHSAKGKGAAVRAGVAKSRGEYLFICDADLSMPIAQVQNLLPPRVVGYDIVIASREALGAIRYDEPFYRHLMGRIFNLFVRTAVIPGLQDTQCGFKLFRREVALDVFACQTITGWAFDVEILYIALRRGYRVTEVSIDWYFNADSRVDPVGDTWRMLWDLIHIHLNAWRGIYDQGYRLNAGDRSMGRTGGEYVE